MMDAIMLFYLLKPLPEYVTIKPYKQILSGQAPICEEIPYHQADELAKYRHLQNEINRLHSIDNEAPELQKLMDELSQTSRRLEVLADPRWSTPQYDIGVSWFIPKDVMLNDQDQIPSKPNQHPLTATMDKIRLTGKTLQLLDFYFGDQNTIEELPYLSWRFIHVSPHFRDLLVDVSFTKKVTAIEYCQSLPLLQIEIELALKFEKFNGGVKIQTQKFYLTGVVL